MNRFWVILILIAAGIFLIVQVQLSRPEIEAERVIKEWEAAMKSDVYGGKKPEETLKMFVGALSAGDIEKAGQFFLLDEKGGRGDWPSQLAIAKKEGKLTAIIELIGGAKPALEEITHDGDFKFAIYENGAVAGFINMELNKFSDVWKIESL